MRMWIFDQHEHSPTVEGEGSWHPLDHDPARVAAQQSALEVMLNLMFGLYIHPALAHREMAFFRRRKPPPRQQNPSPSPPRNFRQIAAIRIFSHLRYSSDVQSEQMLSKAYRLPPTCCLMPAAQKKRFLTRGARCRSNTAYAVVPIRGMRAVVHVFF